METDHPAQAAMELSASDRVLATSILSALKIGAGFDWKGAITAIESGSTQTKIVDGMLAADDVAKIVGLFIPPVAVIANDAAIAISVEETAYALIQWFRAQPSVTPVSQPSLWSRIAGIF